MELGFGPKLSRVAAGLCPMLLLGGLEYAFGAWREFAISISLLALFLLLSVLLPVSSNVRRFAGRVARALDVLRPAEWLEDRFENPKRS